MTYEESRRRWVCRINRPAFVMAYKFRQFDSYETLAKTAGVSKGTIGNLLTRGRAHRPHVTPEVAEKIARALGVRVDDVFVLDPLHVETTGNVA